MKIFASRRFLPPVIFQKAGVFNKDKRSGQFLFVIQQSFYIDQPETAEGFYISEPPEIMTFYQSPKTFSKEIVNVQ